MAEFGDRVRSLVPFDVIKQRFRLRKRGDEVAAEKEVLAADIRFCPNCDTPLAGAYCNQCGQKDADLRSSCSSKFPTGAAEAALIAWLHEDWCTGLRGISASPD